MCYNLPHGPQAVHKLPPGAGPRVVFADVEFKESQAVFHRLGVKALPWLFRLPAGQRVDAGATIKLKHEDVVRHLNFESTPVRDVK